MGQAGLAGRLGGAGSQPPGSEGPAGTPEDIEALRARLAAAEQENARLRALLDVDAPAARRRAAQERQRFWQALNDALRPLAEPEEVMAAAAGAVGLHLAAVRAGYAEIDAAGEWFTVSRDWTAPGSASVAGRHRLGSFGSVMADALRAGETVAIADVREDPRTAEAAEAFAEAGHRATLVVPLVKDGRLAAAFFVHDGAPRSWTPEEVGLAEEVGQRVWAAVRHARAEAALRLSEERLRATQEGAGVGIAETDGTGRYIRVNEAFCRITGYSREELMGLTSWDLTHPEDVGEDQESFAHQRDGKVDTYALEKRFVRRNGSVGWCWLSAAAVRDGAGRFRYAVRVIHDITERRAAEEALRASEEKLRVALLAARLGAWERNLVTGELTATATCKANLGLSPDEPLTFERLQELRHPEDAERVGQAIARAIREGVDYDVEYRVVHPDGAVRWLLARGHAVRGADGRPIRMVGVTLDITDRKETEVALRESEERMRLAAEVTGLGTWDVLPASGARQWSREFRAIIGFAEDEPADPARFTGLIHPDDRDWVSARYAAVFQPGGSDRYEAEFRIHRADDGRERWVRTTGRVLRDEAGMPQRAIGTLIDVTERRSAEAAIRESEERYRRLVELSPDATFVDIDTTIVFTNEAALRLLGASSPEEVLGRSSFDFIEPESVALARARAIRLKTTNEANPPVEQVWRRLDGTPIHVEVLSSAVPWGGARATQVILRDIAERRRAQARQLLLLGELNHRVKNTLAAVQSIAAQTLRTTADPEAFRERFEGRLLALSKAHNLLTERAWEAASLRDLLAGELAPYGAGEGGRISVAGPPVEVGAKAVVSLGMAFHELSTNAAKYGALSRPEGRLEVRWEVVGAPGARRLHLDWVERGGPPIPAAPTRRGFGSRLLERGVAAELGGTIRLAYEPEGLACRLEIPLDGSGAA